MKLRVATWNVRRARSNSPVWDIIAQIDADILLLQEVIDYPQSLKEHYSTFFKSAYSKSGKKQIFSTAILAKGEISQELALASEFDWVNKELDLFDGNLLPSVVKIDGLLPIHVVSVYSPAWPADMKRLKNIDVCEVKLKLNPNVWCTELLWSGLKSNCNIRNEHWIVAGDFNSSVTFDYLWKNGPRGNQEIVDRMNAIGLKECLYSFNGKLTPTFKNPNGGKVIHQLDHMYVSEIMLSSLTASYVIDDSYIFERSISDHLPIVSDFLLSTDKT